MYKSIVACAVLVGCLCRYVPAGAQVVQNCNLTAELYTQGELFINYGSAVNAYSIRNRSDYLVGEPAIGYGYSQQWNTYLGYWSRLLVPPLPAAVTATQGDLLDRIRLSWSVNVLGSYPTEGFNLYRDGFFLGYVGPNVRTYNDFNVIAGRPYNYEVRGVNQYGEGSGGKAIGFQVPNGVVTGRIQTISGRPVQDALVTLTPLQGFSAKFDPGEGAFAMSNMTGAADTLIPLNNGEWTLSFWVKTTSAAANAGILAFHPFPLTIRPIASATGFEGIEVAQTGNSPAVLSGRFPDDKKNDWNHVALTVDSDGKGRLYLNGILIQIGDLPPLVSASELRLGARTGTPGAWTGRLDELRIYHRRLDELDLAEAGMGTASSLTPGLKYYWKMDEELGTASFDLLRRNKLYFCDASFDADRPTVRTMGKTDSEGFYRIESASYGTGITFIAEPMKDFYMYRALKFVRDEADYATLPDFALTPKATLELWVNSAGPDGTQCLLSKKWSGNDFRVLLEPNGVMNELKIYLNGAEHNFGNLGLGYQHLAFTIDSSGADRTIKAYKNGQPFGSPHTFGGVTGNWSDPAGTWVLGARESGGYTDHFGGLIDEVAVYDTTLNADSINSHYLVARNMQERGLRVYFNLDEGNGNRLNNSGSVLLPFGTNNGAEWSPFAARQATSPHEFTPKTRQVTLNPSITSVDQVDFIDRSTVPVTGYVRYQNTDCFAKNVEILVNGASFSPKVLTDSTGKFTIEFDPGTTATLTPVFPDTAKTAEADVPHVFTPGFWDVTNVNNPIAGILFNDVTTRTVRGIVAGGSKAGCNKSIIKAPPGQGQGTVCVVKVRSTDGCFERQIVLDNQEGEYEFADLPPLESMTVAVVEHSDPDVKAAFQTAGGSTVNLSLLDTVINFIYIAPPEVEIASGLTPIGTCSDIVLDKGENIQLEIKLKEVYVPIVDNMGMVLDDGICYLDTADFKIINGISDTELDTVMGQGKLRYKFKVGDPNPSPPYLKTLQLIGTSLAGRIGSLSTQVIVTGIRNKENTFTTVSPPQIPTIILRDPPGDGSYAYLEKDTTVCKTTAMSFDFEVGGGGGVEAHLAPKLETATAPGGVGPIVEQGPVFDINAEFQVTYQKIESNAFQTCMSISSRLSTSASDKFIGADGDVYLGEAWNIIFGFADQVSFNATTCTPGISTLLVVQPDSFPTVFMYTQYQVENFVMRYLDSLITNPMATPDEVASFATSKARWQQILDRNAGLKQKAKLKRNISFDAGIEYEYAETSDTTDSKSVEELTNSEESLTTHFGYEFSKAGVIGMVKFVSGTSDSDSDGSENSRSITTGYVLADDNDGDAFSVDVAIDSAYKTPVFRLKAGQSSCPWEEGTANRDAPNLQLGQGTQFTAVNVPADEPAVFKLNLGNLSATNEDRYYGLTANPASNPDGAIIRVNGQELNANTIPYNVPFGESIPVTLTVERGPVAYEYEDLQVALVADCELEYRDYNFSVAEPNDAKFISLLKLGVDFIRPCSEVDVTVPEQNWVVLNNDPVQPGTIRRITVSGYDLNSSDFQLVRVQYRRSNGDGAWINIVPPTGGEFEAFNPRWSGFYNTQADTFRKPGSDTLLLGADFTNFSWETAGIGDGDYEIHAWAVCTGDASDKPGFSEIIKGRIDREPPSIVGVPQPSDGVYQVGDEISFTFNQHINCDRLNPVDDVLLFDATTNQPIAIDITCFENKIVLTPTAAFQNKFFENRILRAELKGIEDLVGNVFNGTKFNKGIWEFYVDRNELGWLTDSVGLTKYEDETKTVTANIHNRGGYHVPFKILQVPDWVQVVPDQGTMAPNESRPISFTVNNTVAFGHWADTIVLETQTGQNPFFMGGSEPLPTGARVVCRPPYLPVNLAQYENTMSMVLKLNIEGVFSADAEDIVAAYINDEFRGMAKVQYVPQVNAWLAYLTVYGNPADLLQPIRLEVWDASMCQRYSSIIESFTYQPDNVIGITDNPQVVHTAGLLMREVPINFGWNWLSFNLAFPDNSLNAALASLKHADGSLMRSQTSFATNSGGTWFGPLTQLNNTKMFIYRADMPDTLRMQGTPIDPTTTPIPVVTGWNWIGYVPDYSLPVNEALASVPAQYGDVVKSQYAFAQYLNPTFGWVGNLKFMMPPNGYQLKLSQAGTLTYPPPPTPLTGNTAQERGETEPAPTHWTVNPTQFEHSSTLIGMIRSNGINATTSDMELAAFAGNEMRGTAQAIYIEPLDAHLFFLTTYANTSGELLRFKLYDDADGSVRDLSETMHFAPNQHSGSIENPVPFELLTTRTEEDFGTTQAFDVQPNPFATETTIRFALAKAEEVTLTISDAQGREVVRRPISAVAGQNVATWNGRSDAGSWLSSGVYTVRLQTAAGNVMRKVVLQRLP